MCFAFPSALCRCLCSTPLSFCHLRPFLSRMIFQLLHQYILSTTPPFSFSVSILHLFLFHHHFSHPIFPPHFCTPLILLYPIPPALKKKRMSSASNLNDEEEEGGNDRSDDDPDMEPIPKRKTPGRKKSIIPPSSPTGAPLGKSE